MTGGRPSRQDVAGWEETRCEAVVAAFTTERLVDDARRLSAESRSLREDCRRLRARRPADPSLTRFRLGGSIDGVPVQAEWTPDGGVSGSEKLMIRADLVVRLGDRFPDGGGSRIAALDGGPTEALLTLARACDTVHWVETETGAGEGPVDPAAVPDDR